MSRWIEADALIEKAFQFEEQGDTFCVDSAEELEILFDDLASSIDIVRCKECKNYNGGEVEHEYERCRHFLNYVEPTDYCSYGERKDNG